MPDKQSTNNSSHIRSKFMQTGHAKFFSKKKQFEQILLYGLCLLLFRK